MNFFRTGFLLLLGLTGNSLVPAEEVPAKLPKDGWWVRYYVITKREVTNEEWTMIRTYSLVGTTTENDQKSRWVEMKSVQTINGKEQTDIIKFLVPEKELLEGERPLESLVRAWRRIDDGEVEEQKFNQPLGVRGFSGGADFYFGHDVSIFPGAQRSSKPVDEKKVVNYQQGRLELAEGRVGKRLAKRRAITADVEYTILHDLTTWSAPVLAPAFAAASMRIVLSENGKPRPMQAIEYAVEDFGTGAKSALPENN